MPVRRLLIADDDPQTRELIRTVLAADFDVIEEVADGRELFWRLMRSAFTDASLVAIADVVLPGYDGLEVLDACRYLGFRLPVLVISGLPRAQVEPRARALGAPLLVKPFSAQALRGAIASL